MAEKRRWDTIQIIDSVALSAPAVRMAIVYGAWGIDEETGREDEPWSGFTPVIAIQAAVCRTYSRQHQERMASYATTREIEADGGWHGESSEVVHGFLVMDPTGNEYGFCLASEAFECRSVRHEPVACPWPPEEDAERLAPIMAKMVASAKASELARLAREKRPIPAERRAGGG